MKLKRIISVVILFVAIVQQSLAQQNFYFISPEINGYTLTRSTTIDGLKCDHYEKGSEEVRTFRKSNGDFVTFKEDYNGFNRIPDKHDESIGSNRVTYKNGVVQSCETHPINGFNVNFMVVTLKNGNKLMMNRIISMDYKSFKTPGEFLLNEDDIAHITHVSFADNPTVFHRCKDGKITIGQTVYVCDNKGNIEKTSLLFSVEGTNEKLAVHVVESEGLMRVEKANNGDYIYSYANGDKVIKGSYSNEGQHDLSSFALSIANGHGTYLKEGTIKHFENGVLKIKNGKYLFYMNDGSIYNGSFKEAEASLMHYKKITPYNGIIQYANGTVDNLIDGDSEKEIDKRKKENEKKEIQKRKQDYGKLCKIYGKKYVDAAIAGQVIVGMPEKLFTSAFQTSLKAHSQYSKTYYVYGWGWENGGRTLSNTALTHIVHVSNGKVTSVRKR